MNPGELERQIEALRRGLESLAKAGGRREVADETALEKLAAAVDRLRDAQEELRRQNEQLTRARAYAESIVETVREPLVVLDEQLRVVTANRSFYNFFRTSQAVTEGAALHELGDGQWGAPALRELLEKARSQDRPFENFQLEQDFPGIGRRAMLLSARRIASADGKPELILLAMEDVTQRKRAEEQRLEAHGLLESIFSTTHLLIAYLDRDFNFIRVNRAYADADEREVGFFPGKSHFKLYPNPENEVIFRRVVRTGQPYFAYEKPFQYADVPERGTTYWDWSLVPVKDAQGQVEGLILSVVDVTERVRTEQELRSSEARYRTLVERLPAVTYVAAMDGSRTTLYVSPQVESMLGLSPEDFEAEPDLWRRRLHGEDRQRVLREVQQGVESSRPFVAEYRMYARDGRLVWVRDEAAVVRDEAGAALFLQGVMTDITARKRAEEALSAERQRLYSVLNFLPGYVTLVGPDYSLRFVNHRFLDLFGSPGELPCYAAQFGRDRPCDDCRLQRILQTGQAEDWEVTVSGDRTYHVWGYAFSDVDGTAAVLKLGIDVTERKRLQQEVIEAGETERRNVGRDLHDTVGQDLTGLAFLIKVLAAKLGDRSPEDASAARQVVALVNDLVSQVRSLARGLDPVGLHEDGLANGLHELAHDTQKLFGVSCKFRCDRPVVFKQRSAATHLYHIAREAVNNAVKHARAGSIEIALLSDGEDIRLTVEDDGIGMPEDAEKAGGMGMHIMRYRAGVIGGALRVGPGARGGTAVTCSLPRTEADPQLEDSP